MSRAEQLEREAEQTRSRLLGNLEELRASMTPGQVVDQLADYTKVNAGDVARNLRDRAAQNPLPVVLIGAGIAWLMLGGRASFNGSGMTDTIGQMGQRIARTAKRQARNDRKPLLRIERISGDLGLRLVQGFPWSQCRARAGEACSGQKRALHQLHRMRARPQSQRRPCADS